VYGIERSAIAEQARQIIEDNKYQDRITIIQGKVEEVDLPVPQVHFIRAFVLDLALCHISMGAVSWDGILHACSSQHFSRSGSLRCSACQRHMFLRLPLCLIIEEEC